jgi:outer membrane protein assembly factor BamD
MAIRGNGTGRKRRRLRLPLAAVLGCALLAGGCGEEPVQIPLATVGADNLLFDRGNTALQEGDWRTAREYFLQIRDNYPQSALRADTRLAIGDTLDAEGTIESYISALSEYRDFLALYPTHPRADYAQYRLAMVYYNQMRQPERDQTETHNAVTEFELFLQRYPGSRLINEVREKLREALDRLSENNYVVGKYYHGRKWYPGAIDRLETILSEDPGYTARDAVYYHLADSLSRTTRIEEAHPMFERLLEEFPESEFIEDATERMAELTQQAARRAAAASNAENRTENQAENR